MTTTAPPVAHDSGDLQAPSSFRNHVCGLPGKIELDRGSEALDGRPYIGECRAGDRAGVSIGPVSGLDDLANAGDGLLTQCPDLVDKAHSDSSSVVPGVAPSGDDATVEVTGDTARMDSSPRRVAGSRAPIIPPYMCYALTVAPSRIDSPSLPAVDITQTDIDGTWATVHRLRPSQARDLAAWLIEAADQAEGVQA